MSITQLCAHGCIALFTNTIIIVTLHDTVKLTGTQSTATDRFWTLTPLPATSHPITQPLNAAITGSINAMFHTTLAHDTIASIITFYHASC
jgi:ABC-type cobalt transport system substrate-binding protein